MEHVPYLLYTYRHPNFWNGVWVLNMIIIRQRTVKAWLQTHAHTHTHNPRKPWPNESPGRMNDSLDEG